MSESTHQPEEEEIFVGEESKHIAIEVERETNGHRVGRIASKIVLVLLCVFFLTAGAGISVLRRSSTIRDAMPGLLDGLVRGKLDYNWQPDVQFPEKKAMNVLILGCDHDYDDKDQIVKNAWGRSDSIMMARFDFSGNRIDALTIPRDTAVRIPGHRGVHKINAAHSYGGPALTVETVKDVFGIDADAVIEVNFEGFQEIVNALDGIDLNVEKKLDYDDNWGHLHIHLKPGEQHMNGYQAMGYVRMRHSDTDQMRSKRQHNFIEAMRTKAKQPSTFGKLPAAVDRLSDSIKHYSMSMDQMFALINFARKLPKENINIETLPSFEGPSFVTVDVHKSEEMIKRLFFADRRVALNINTPDPNHMREQNGSGEKSGKRRQKSTTHSKAHPAPKNKTNTEINSSDPAATDTNPDSTHKPTKLDDTSKPNSGVRSPGDFSNISHA